ncbi:MAG TPA: hypothetical protein VMU47_23730 [Caldimonas sp.]|nr:hypothetical protein [Caldimonas sp.]
MRRAAIVPLVSFVVALNGCSILFGQRTTLDQQLTQDQAELTSCRQANLDCGPVQQRLVQIAREANQEAASTKNPKDAVSAYRIAAVAAWQAGLAGKDLVLPVTSAGTAACDALPQKDKDAPRDCSLIRLALPMAVQDEIALKLIDLKKERDEAQRRHERHCQDLQGDEAAACHATRGKLPATDLSTETTMFNDLESQFTKVSDIRAGLHDLDLPAEFTTQTDAQRSIIYCNAVADWRLTADTEGGDQTFHDLAPRKQAMLQRLQQDKVDPNCGGFLAAPQPGTPPSPEAAPKTQLGTPPSM